MKVPDKGSVVSWTGSMVDGSELGRVWLSDVESGMCGVEEKIEMHNTLSSCLNEKAQV
jgi:hypothetical protein